MITRQQDKRGEWQMKYNLSYEADGKRVELKNITPEQMQVFLEKLERKDESSLVIKRVDDREEER